MLTIKTNIVGLKHKNVDKELIDKIVKKEILLKKEPNNKFDKFAIKCMSDNFHFGYIEAVNSEKISLLLNQSDNFKIDIVDFNESKIAISIIFEVTKQTHNFVKINEGDVPGIYQISFRLNGHQYCYIGQSTNINYRLLTHYRNLTNLEHHNDLIQTAWINDSNSFNHSILERCSKNLSVFERQVFLFQKEFFYIKNSRVTTANKIDADLVMTKDALSEIKGLVNIVKSKLKIRRKKHVLNKGIIGQKIIDAGIMKEEKFWDGYQRGGEPRKYLEVKASNILTWLNKKRYGNLDYRPRILRHHELFENLSKSLEEEQKKVFIIDKKNKFLEEFIKKFKNKGKFETCNVDDLEYFLKIVDEISLNIIEKSSFKNNSNNNVQNKITKSIIQKSDDRLNKQIEDKVSNNVKKKAATKITTNLKPINLVEETPLKIDDNSQSLVDNFFSAIVNFQTETVISLEKKLFHSKSLIIKCKKCNQARKHLYARYTSIRCSTCSNRKYIHWKFESDFDKSLKYNSIHEKNFNEKLYFSNKSTSYDKQDLKIVCPSCGTNNFLNESSLNNKKQFKPICFLCSVELPLPQD